MTLEDRHQQEVLHRTDENETADFDGDFCDTPVDQKQKRHLRYAQREKRKCLYLMMLKLVPKVGLEPRRGVILTGF